MKFTKSIVMMLVIIVALLCVIAAHHSKLFYYGQFKYLAYEYFPGAFTAEVDHHHNPLLGCEVSTLDNIHTHFFHVEMKSQVVPTESVGYAGGGMTSRGGEMLLINVDGDIFLATDSTITKTRIKVPGNNREIFNQARDDRQYRNPIQTFKYEDILAFDNGILISYTQWYPEQECYTLNVALLPLLQGDLSILDVEANVADWEIIYRSSPCLSVHTGPERLQLHMSGARMAMLNPTQFLLTVGDFNAEGIFPEGSNPQSLDNDYGKILLIDTITFEKEIYSIGHRNPQGITVDSNGEVWAVEHGPRGGDELNHIYRGNNYGWPEATLGTSYTTLPLPNAGQYARHDEYEAPVFSWIPSRGISNITQINNFDAAWDGDYLIATMSMERLYRIRIKNDRVLFSEPLCIGRRVRYVHQHTTGQIFVWTDDSVLYIIGQPLKPAANQNAEALLTVSACLECHTPDGGAAGAPGIGELTDRLSPDRIAEYIKNPRDFNPNSQMPAMELSDQELAEITTALQKLSN